MQALLFLLIFLPLVHSERTVACTNGFELINNKCLKFISIKSSWENAKKICSMYTGHLVTIRNGVENFSVFNLSGNNTEGSWIGMRCSGNDVSNCNWDNRNASNETFYNFAPSFPLNDYGDCVFLKTTGPLFGKWLTGDCKKKRSFICEIPTTFDDSCRLNYNGSCYISSDHLQLPPTYGMEAAKSLCEQKCGQLVSIHSEQELRFIQNYYETVGRESIMIGAVATSDFQWLDGSTWNYNKFGNIQSGVCVEMPLSRKSTNDVWMYTRCDKSHHFMCKRLAGVQCDKPGNSAESTNDEESVFSSMCHRQLEIEGSFAVEFYSRNNFECSYNLTTSSTQRIVLYVMNSNLIVRSGNRYVNIYDGDSEESPLIASLTGSLEESNYFESSGNQLFVSYGDYHSNDPSSVKFHASFFSIDK